MSAERSTGGQPSELVLRVVSALVLIVIVLAATWYGGPVFALLCAVAAVLVLVEYLQIVADALPDHLGRATLGGLGGVLAVWFAIGPSGAMLGLGAVLCLVLVWELWRTRGCWAGTGLLYALLPMFALFLLRSDERVGLHAVFLIFACVWGADTLAYFAGRTIGGPKLAPRISPKKTWAGFFGGLVGSLVAASAVLLLAGYALSGAAFALMIALSIVSQLGDLFESWIKRRFGKKDSGRIIPGHGGMLDRIDGLIAASVAAWIAGGIVAGGPLVPGAAARGLFAAFILP